MADAGWGQGRPDSGIMQVLVAYIMQGGQLAAARRRPDNPLTLTHLLWQGPEGANLEAIRMSNGERESPTEREVWVQMALHLQASPIAYASRPNESPWLQLSVDRELVSQWVRLLRQGSQGPMNYPPASPPYVSGPPFANQVDMDPHDALPRRESLPPTGPFSDGMPPRTPWPPSVPLQPSTPPPPPPQTPPGREAGPRPEPWDRSRLAENGEVSVLLAVEVELPPVMNNPAAADYRRDFARDVAMHFGRAARTIPQVRQVRGWMRGDRLLLAARFAVAPGNRMPTRAEMDGAAQLLANVLAQRTLPYVQLAFANPGEWVQGAPLPE